MIGCAGGGSNFGGIAFPFLRSNDKGTRIIAVEPAACPTPTWRVHRGTTAMRSAWRRSSRCTPSATGSSRPGSTPAACGTTGWRSGLRLVNGGYVEAQAIDQLDTFEGGIMFAKAEGILPAPESNHAVRVAINEALACKETGDEKVILFNLSGHGNFDMKAYDAYLSGQLERYEYPADDIAAAMGDLPAVSFPG
ncbi:MAG: pyridoxal-phosphate dependent enzyme [Ilumatobacteraceae bacterium]